MSAISEKGYISDELAFLWIKEFDRETRDRMVGRKEERILLVDGRGSRLAFELLTYAEENRIKVIAFPPNKTNYDQHWMVSLFRLTKLFFADNLNSQWGGGLTANKNSFLQDLKNIKEALTQRICRESFRYRGIFPVNADLACKPLEDILPPIPELYIDLERTPSPFLEDLQSSSLENTPSKTLFDVERRRKKLSKIGGITPKQKRLLNKVADDLGSCYGMPVNN